jgi:homoaconitase/3-isopropylmalate dehydratase large subunit
LLLRGFAWLDVGLGGLTSTFAVMDHNVPTTDRTEPVREPMSAAQMAALRRNAEEFGIMLFDYFSPFQGIVHVIGPELGLTLPGITLSAATATHPPTGPSGPSHSASGQARASTSSQPRRSG